MNRSIQREVIMEVLHSTVSHPTAEWIHGKAREKLPNISLGTVYRNLSALVEAGKIIKVQGAFEKDRYDGNYRRHAHMVCERCGAVIDVDMPEELDGAIMKAIDSDAIAVNDYSIVYKGLCAECVKADKCDNAKIC